VYSKAHIETLDEEWPALWWWLQRTTACWGTTRRA